MPENVSIIANNNVSGAKPGHGLANIFFIFACGGDNQITRFCQAFCIGKTFAQEGLCFIRAQFVVSVELSIVDTGNTLIDEMLFLKARSTKKNANLAQRLIFHSIRTEAFNQLVNLAHYYASKSATMASILRRSSSSRATMRAISALSSAISISSRSSFFST